MPVTRNTVCAPLGGRAGTAAWITSACGDVWLEQGGACGRPPGSIKGRRKHRPPGSLLARPDAAGARCAHARSWAALAAHTSPPGLDGYLPRPRPQGEKHQRTRSSALPNVYCSLSEDRGQTMYRHGFRRTTDSR